MRTIVIAQILIAVILSTLLASLHSTQSAMSFFLGSSVLFLNFLFLWFGWSGLFHKKQIALPILIIVFKYAILGIIVYGMMQIPGLQLVWFLLGSVSFLAAALIYAGKNGI